MRLVTTLAVWFVAFLIVLVLLSLFGRKLESLPHALNALIFTGVLVPIMGNVVMPVSVPRWDGGCPARPKATCDAATQGQPAKRAPPLTIRPGRVLQLETRRSRAPTRRTASRVHPTLRQTRAVHV